MKRVNIRIYGKVQGVFFRYNAKKLADKLGVNGWVRNCPDDTVHIMAEGNNDKIKVFINWCRHGPIGSNVRKIEIKEKEYKNEFKNFSIIY
jgi:acylphosphatase